MRIERVAGRRREVRRELAQISRAVLELHRRDAPHVGACPLCAAAKPAPSWVSDAAIGAAIDAAFEADD